MNIDISSQDLQDVLTIFAKKAFGITSAEEGGKDTLILKLCENLLKADYNVSELDNLTGSLSSCYPSRIFIPVSEKHNIANGAASNGASNGNGGIQSYVTFANSFDQQKVTENTIYEDEYNMGKVRDLIENARYARCRQRFVTPVILYRGKRICRSATISIKPETYGRKVVDFAYDCFLGSFAAALTNVVRGSDGETIVVPTTDLSNFSYEEAIKSDIALLKALNVGTIVDLMVEKQKIKYFFSVSSSEKAVTGKQYDDFNLVSLPYPGCEFFLKFRENSYSLDNLYYNWNEPFNDAPLNVPENGPAYDIGINWPDYREWELVLLTTNYLKATLRYIHDDNKGVLIHCISGWDRTPLFISLIRLSLWADGLIHQSLNPEQMAYFTLAYDWYLFGHQLPDRIARGEDILLFCFYVLKAITSDEFSLIEPRIERRRRTKTASSSGSCSSSVIVLKSDCCDDDPDVKDDLDYLMCSEQDSNESFTNISNCDMPITDHHFNTNNITSRSPNPKRAKTTPIPVPAVEGSRQHLESLSSVNGSWQMLTVCGSIDLSKTSSSAQKDTNGGPSNGDTGKAGANVETLRKKRLESIRAVFMNAYGKTIGLQFQHKTRVSLFNKLFGNLF